MERLASELAENLEAFRALFHAPENCDFVVRELAPHGVRMAALYIDGMANRENLEDMVLRPLMNMRPFAAWPRRGGAPRWRRRCCPPARESSRAA